MARGQVKKEKDMEPAHLAMVERLLSDARPVSPIRKAWVQWALWVVLSFLMIGAMVLLMGMGSGMGAFMGLMPPMMFVLMAFLGSALAAWEAIASSVPGRQTGPSYRAAAILVLAALFLFPVVFFAPAGQGFDPLQTLREGWACSRTVSLLGLPSWVLLAWLVSRNAPFRPAWTGAWTGASAFLLSMATVQMRCPNNQWPHVLMAHLLPVAVFMVLASWAGIYWFSRWKK